MTTVETLKESPILIVDDQKIVRLLFKKHLRQSGFTTIYDVTNGQEALDMLRSRSFDLVLLDVIMPVMNGYATLEKIKADEALRRVSVIMVTAVDEIESVAKCIQLGAEDYMPKLFNSILLDARILGCLERHYLRRRVRELEALASVQHEPVGESGARSVV